MMSNKQKPLEQPELTYFVEAIGWMELGNPQEALLSLKTLPVTVQNHFDVLRLRWSVQYKLQNFSECKSIGAALVFQFQDELDSWMLYAQAFYNLKDYKKAFDTLQSVESKFSNDWHFAYDYACYHSLTHDFTGAARWLEIARKKGGKKEVNQLWEHDPDFDPLRKFLES